jgi:Ca-activated chloride channel family protein
MANIVYAATVWAAATGMKFPSIPLRYTFLIAALAGLWGAVQLGVWLAQSQQPLSRHAVGLSLLPTQAYLAAQMFEDSAWQAVALYRAGHYQRAATLFNNTSSPQEPSVTALYNTANALAYLGYLNAAIDALEHVLSEQPQHEDARHNLAILREAQATQAQRQESQQESQPAHSDPAQASTTPQQPHQGRISDEGREQRQVSKENPQQNVLWSSVSQAAEEPGTDNQSADEEQGESTAQTDVMQGGGQQSGTKNPQGRPPDHALFALQSNNSNADTLGPVASSSRSAPAQQLERALAQDVLLRQITDKPAVVLRARFHTVYRQRRSP